MDPHTKELVVSRLFNRFNRVPDKKIDKEEFYEFLKYVFNKLGYNKEFKLLSKKDAEAFIIKLTNGQRNYLNKEEFI